MVRHAYLLCLLVIAACSFDRAGLDDRGCTEPDDCEPDEDCTKGICLQRACQTGADCGSSYVFTCRSGGCEVQDCELASECGANQTCPEGYCAPLFNVESATSTGNTSMSVTFDATPEEFSATTRSNYAVSGLGLLGTPVLSDRTVSLTTSPQSAGATYSLIVSNVLRASDGESLATATASFTGN